MDEGEENGEDNPREENKDAAEHVDNKDGAEEGANHGDCWVVLLERLHLGLCVGGVVHASKY